MKELYAKASAHTENPPKALQTLFSMHYKWVATPLPYGFHMKHDVTKGSS